jgi:hypothetical protein
MQQKHNIDFSELRIDHGKTLKSIEMALEHVEKDIKTQIDKFNKSKQSKNYSFLRTASGLGKWRKDVVLQFKGHCCICLSNEKLNAHHLYSYKYYPKLRTELNNGVCLCVKCHVLFHEYYDTRNTSGQFFEFIKIMKDERLKSYIKVGIGISNPKSLTLQLLESNEEYKVIELIYLKIIIVKNVSLNRETIYYALTDPFYQ